MLCNILHITSTCLDLNSDNQRVLRGKAKRSRHSHHMALYAHAVLSGIWPSFMATLKPTAMRLQAYCLPGIERTGRQLRLDSRPVVQVARVG